MGRGGDVIRIRRKEGFRRGRGRTSTNRRARSLDAREASLVAAEHQLRREVDDDGTVRYYLPLCTELHRMGGPAVCYPDGGQEWWFEGRRHRDEDAAVELADGTREFWVRGRRSRLMGPAIIAGDGSRHWFLAGMRHRADGPAVILADTSCMWYVDGVLHREGQPAVQLSDGTVEWWEHGVRLDSPRTRNRGHRRAETRPLR